MTVGPWDPNWPRYDEPPDEWDLLGASGRQLTPAPYLDGRQPWEYGEPAGDPDPDDWRYADARPVPEPCGGCGGSGYNGLEACRWCHGYGWET